MAKKAEELYQEALLLSEAERERLALLLETGTPLHTSLQALADQADNPLMKTMITDLQDAVAGGLSFSQALDQHPEVFPPSFVSVVAAGEQGGFLYTVVKSWII